MASGKFDLWSSNTKLAGKIEWSSTSNGSSANTSNLTVALYVRRTDGYTTKGTWTGEIDFGGETFNFSHSSTSVGSDWVLMISKTKTVAHNNDGTKQEWIHGECFAPSGTSLAGDSVGGSQTVTLDTIPRNSAVSLSKTSFNIGETITIKTNRKSTNFTHTIRVVIGSLNKTLATNVGDSWNWATNANQDLYGQVYNVASKGGTIYCDCYNGSTLIGTSSVGFTATAVKSSISSNANWTAGNTLTVNISRPSSKYTHTVEVLVNGTVVGTATGVGTSTSFNTTAFHTNVFKALAQTASKSTTIKVTTYNGSANLGSTTITGTVTAPAASTANVPTWTAGNTYTASITRANSSFTHTVQLLVGTTSIFTSTGVGTSVTKSDVSFHTNVFKALAQAGSKETTVKVTTYYNGVQVRSQTSKTGKVTAPAASTSTIDNFNIGDTKTISITRANSSFTHKVEVLWGDWSKTLSSSAGTSVSWNTSTDASTMYSKIPNNISGVGGIRTTTYYNGVQVRSATSKTFTAYVVNSNPTFTAFSYKDNNTTTSNVTGNNQLQIQNKSNLVVIVSAATPKNSATIKKYIATINGKNYESTSTTINIGAISKSGTLALQVKAVDSRGLSTSVSKNITVVSYTQPSYTVEVTRKNNYEQETTIEILYGKYTSLLLEWKENGFIVQNPNPNAIVTSQYRYKASDGNFNAWKSITLNESKDANKDETNFNFSELVGNLDNTKTFIFEVQIADKITTITQTFTLKNGTPIMAMRKQSIGINKVPTISKGIDIDGDINFTNYEDKIVMKGSLTDNRKLSLDTGNVNYDVSNSGGWANGLKFRTNDGQSTLGGIGAFGNPNSLEYYYIGGTYDNPYLKIDNIGNGAFKGDMYANAHRTINGMFYFSSNSSSKKVLTVGNGITLGQDQASAADANLRLHSWYGIGFAPSVSGQAIPQGENAVYINVRNGALTARGTITAPKFVGNVTGNLNGNANTATKATTADSAGSATKATQDGNSLVIADNYSKAQTNQNNTGLNRVGAGQELQRSGLYTLTNTGGAWRNLINVRHRNGGGDGISYGMQIYSSLTEAKPLIYVRKQANGAWGAEEIFDVRYTLYNNASGSTGTISLSQSASSFSYLDIYFLDNNSSNLSSVRVCSPDGKIVALSILEASNSNKIFMRTKNIKISGTAISVYDGRHNYCQLYSTQTTINIDNSNFIKIIRVDGIR